MSEPTNNFPANTVLPAAQLNQNITEALNDYRDFTCGTTITAGQAVCINPADGKIYPCDSGYADYRTKNFVGFAVTGGSSSAVIKVQIGGKFAGLSGLTAGDFYYLNTAGTIGTSPGTYQQKVGLAVLSTALIITGSQVTVSTDATMADNSDLEVPSQKAVKTYVDNTPPTSANGIATKNLADTSGSQTIAHGLGRTPKKIRITAISVSYYGGTSMSVGAYDGTHNSCVYFYPTNSNGYFVTANASSATYGIILIPGAASGGQAGIITVDGTNITITWGQLGGGYGQTAQIMWEAQ